MALRPNGYLPTPYVIAVLPFAALVTAGTVNALWDSSTLNRFRHLRRQMPLPRIGYSWAQAGVQIPAMAMLLAFASCVLIPRWAPAVVRLSTQDRNHSVRQSLEWTRVHVPKDSRLLVSDAMWVDLVQRGYRPDWYFKVDLDPAVKSKYPNGWRDVDYAIFTDEMNELAKSLAQAEMATVIAAREHGRLVASYGTGKERIWIYQVVKPKAS
jgi:hypothetical protein